MLLYIVRIVITIALGITHAVWIVRRQRVRQAPIGPGPYFAPLIAAVIASILLGAAQYIDVFSAGQLSTTAVFEGLNYSVQTVTTVGFGSWTPAGVNFGDPRLLLMKEFSIALMLTGPVLFTVTVGVFTNWLSTPVDD